MGKFKIVTIAVLTVVSLVGLSACDSNPNDDRQQGGTKPDSYSDSTHVTLYRNVDDVPNIAYFCAGGYGWASTLSNDGSTSPSLVRFPEYDKTCGTEDSAR